MVCPQVVAYVASVEGELVGAYMVQPNHHGRGAHVATATYMVTAPWRRQGIGKTLGDHSLQVATALGFTAMQFNSVVSTNVAAVRLWERLGFVIIGTIPQGFQHATLGLVDLHIMHRFLEGRSGLV